MNISKQEQRKIVTFYSKGGSLAAAALEFRHGPALLRQVLKEAGVTLRGKGRPKARLEK